MPAFVRDSGVWKTLVNYVKDAGVWKNVVKGWVRDAGTWKQYHQQQIAISYLGLDEITAQQTSFTHTAVPIGAAHPLRRILVTTASSYSGTGILITGMTIGGVTATKHVEIEGTNASGVSHSSIWSALVPTGTTADIVTTYNVAAFRDYLGVFKTTSWNGATGTTWTYKLNGTNPMTSGTVVSPAAGGAVLAVAVGLTNGGVIPATWTYLTKAFESEPTGTAQARAHSAAIGNFSTAATNQTVTCSLVGRSNQNMCGVVLVP